MCGLKNQAAPILGDRLETDCPVDKDVRPMAYSSVPFRYPVYLNLFNHHPIAVLAIDPFLGRI